MGIPRYFWHCFLLAGTLILAWELIDSLQYWNAQRLLRRTRGSVLTTVASGKPAGGFSTEIQFSAPDGSLHRFVSQTGNQNAFLPGSKVTVVYEIDDPDHARVVMKNERPWQIEVAVLLLGSVLALIGGVTLYLEARQAKLVDWLKLNGRTIQATFTGVDLNLGLVVGDKSPYRISATWVDETTHEDYEFVSEDLWINPSPRISSDRISVVIDPSDPNRYWMDLSFLT